MLLSAVVVFVVSVVSVVVAVVVGVVVVVIVVVVVVVVVVFTAQGSNAKKTEYAAVAPDPRAVNMVSSRPAEQSSSHSRATCPLIM